MSERNILVQAIASLESRRPVLGDDVVETAVWALRQQLSHKDANATAPTPIENEQQLTVLVADMVGFTTISEQMDAEHVGAALNALWSHLDGVIVAWGGRIDKHVGDNISAYFGVPFPREDDPERAVRAALEIQQVLTWFNREENRATTQNLFPSGVYVQMRIGVHIGPAFVELMGADTNYTAVGETINIAEALETAAPHGGVLVSAEIAQALGSRFVLTPMSPGWLVTCSQKQLLCITQAGAAFDNSLRMIGHSQTFEQLQTGLQYVVDTHSVQLILVTGVEGSGKSKLLTEFGNWLSIFPAPIRLICGRGFAQLSTRPYALLRDVLESYFNMHVRYHTVVAGQMLIAAIHKELLNVEVEPVLAYQYAWAIGHLVGFDFAAELDLDTRLDAQFWLVEQALQGVMCLLTAVAEQGILPVLLLEDIDFATQADLAFIDHLVAVAQNLPLLIVASALPEFEQKRPSWFTWRHDPFSTYAAVELKALSAIDARHLVNAHLKSVDKLPLRIVDIIVSISAGLPIAIEETLRFLADRTVIEGHPNPQRVHLGRLNDIRLPARFDDLLQQQIAQLSPMTQSILKRAAVMGLVFSDTAVLQLSEADQIDIDFPMLQATLNDLEKYGIIFRSPKLTFMGVQDYYFRYKFWQRSAYAQLDVELRRAYHAQCAYWLITICSSSQLPRFAPVIADHFLQAGERDQAAEWNGRSHPNRKSDPPDLI